MSDTGYSTALPPTPALTDKPRARKHERTEMSGKPKFPPTTEERAQIVTMAASGMPQSRIAQNLGRSRRLVKNVLHEPEVVAEIREERAELVEIYREKARDILVSIDAETINKANLLQRATSSGIFLDKSLLLQGRPTQNVAIIVEVLDVLRVRSNEEIERQTQQAQVRLLAEKAKP